MTRKRLTNRQLKSLGRLINILGTQDLEIRLFKHRQLAEELDTRMAKVPKRFHVRAGESADGSTAWKEGSVRGLYGCSNVEITMFYLKPKGGEN